ncbi:hypothetical protein ANRL4_00732 [Anaerolineae bacterium]|nr:hypothetical protein ANRL4_00732 [Anaerolineae bacterium]
MNHLQAISKLEFEWSPEEGFFWRIREGQFIASDYNRAFRMIASIDSSRAQEIPLRFVSLLWYIPLFMQWQVERVVEAGGDRKQYEQAVTEITNEIERILGVP